MFLTATCDPTTAAKRMYVRSQKVSSENCIDVLCRASLFTSSCETGVQRILPQVGAASCQSKTSHRTGYGG